MLSNEQKKEVSELFDLFIDRMKQKHMLKNMSDSIYHETAQRLFNYYSSDRKERDKQVEKALAEIREDFYFSIIPLFYKNKFTIESIADIMKCDTSTVVRNKKRLCKKLYLILHDI